MKAYLCKVAYENSAVKENKTLLVLAENPYEASTLCEKKLVKHYDERITVGTITEYDITKGFALVLE